MNALTVADIKRNGFAALEAALAHGPVHLMKRNRPSAVVLSPVDYAELVSKAAGVTAAPKRSALAVFLAQPPAGPTGLDAKAMTERLAEMHDGWAER